MDGAVIGDGLEDAGAPAPRDALLSAVATAVSARRALGGESAAGACAVCLNGAAACDGACDATEGREPPAAVLRRIERCEAILAARLSLDPIDPMACNPALSLEALHWRCERALRCARKLPAETLGRWAGFVEGCLAMRGLLAADALG